MPTSKTFRRPKLRKHKATGQGLVVLSGVTVYCGKFGTMDCEQRYLAAVAEWMQKGCTPPERKRDSNKPASYLILQLAAAYHKHAEGYLVGVDGLPTGSIYRVRTALKLILEHYANLPVDQFSPLKLKALQDVCIARNFTRSHINNMIGVIKAMFKFGVANELVSESVYRAISCVAGIREGRAGVKQTEPVTPVDDDVVEATLKYCSPIIAAMVKLQRLTGMRPGEVVLMRPMDIDQSGQTWIYRPSKHKTIQHGIKRAVPLGPQAREILKPFLDRRSDAHCFSPADTEKLLGKNHTGEDGILFKRFNLKSRPGPRYTTGSYGLAVARASRKAFPFPKDATAEQRKAWAKQHHWRANRLRHTLATEVRKDHGIEAASTLLGHTSIKTTEIYAEKNLALAVRIAEQSG